MKKIFSTLIMLILLLALPILASAEKNKWKTNDFDFASVHNVIIAETDINPPAIDGYIADPFSQNKIEASLRQALEKRKINVFTQEDIDKGNIPMRNIYLTIKPIVHALGKWSEQKEAYYETRTVYKKITVEDNKGRDTTITVPTNETIYHPARIAWHAVANLEFVVTSPVDKKVYMIVDNRDRVEETDTSGMLGRICNDLAEDISRK